MNRLIIFVRAPVLGRVKSRLAAVLGAEKACAAYKHMVVELLKKLSTLNAVELCFTPPDSLPLIREWLRPGWTARPQASGDLGDRITAAFEHAFASGANRVVLIGSDAPQVSSQDIEDAWANLEWADLVLGPAMDGGYWLIGLRRSIPELFTGMPWGTETVFAETIRRARSLHLGFARLRPLADIDTAADWATYVESSRAVACDALAKNQGGT